VRIRILHETSYSYEHPVRALTQALRVMPRDHEGQVVVSWRIDPSIDGRLRSGQDAFGNLIHHFQADGPFDSFSLRIDGIVETLDTTGFVRGAADPLPSAVYLRSTPLTHPDEAVLLFARKLARAGATPLEQLHHLMEAIHTEMAREAEAAGEPGPVEHAFARRRGSSADLAHLFVASARELGVPARVVAGYVAPQDGGTQAEMRLWAEAEAPGFGWIGFDPTINLCPTETHVRVAVGLDYADVQPLRAHRNGGGGETTEAQLHIQPQNQ
jgi:transglutaminase-like putative cysteine protease